MIFSFESETYLVLLFLVPLMIFLHFASLKRKRKVALKFANFDALARIRGADILSKSFSGLILSCLGVSLLVLGLAGTSFVYNAEGSVADYVLAIDSSRSMEANDFFPTRIDSAKSTAIEFVSSVPEGTKIGVISFSSRAFVESSLTIDKDVLVDSIDGISLGSIGGTDLYETVLTSGNLLEGSDYKSLVIISDGQVNIGNIEEIISYANKNRVVINTIGIGTDEGGSTSYGYSKIDEDSLKAVAFNTGGKYFRAVDKDTLRGSFKELFESKYATIYLDISKYLILLGLICFVLHFVFYSLRYFSLP